MGAGCSSVGVERDPDPESGIRYEHALPGGPIHLDTKKLGRIVDGPGHRAHGDRRTRQRGVGWEVLQVAIDGASRLVYAELLPDERRYTTARFAIRALPWLSAQGQRRRTGADRQRGAYRSRPFARVVRAAGLRHIRTRPYRPPTNGKVERGIRTVLSECTYLDVFAGGEQRRRALERFTAFYNDRRPHLAFKGGPPPRRRLAELVAAA